MKSCLVIFWFIRHYAGMAQLQAQGATFWITLMLFWSPSPLRMCSTPCPNGTRRIRGLVPSDAQLGVSRRSHSLDDLGLDSAPRSCSNLACHVQIFVRGHIYQGRSTIPAVKSNLKDVEMSGLGFSETLQGTPHPSPCLNHCIAKLHALSTRTHTHPYAPIRTYAIWSLYTHSTHR